MSTEAGEPVVAHTESVRPGAVSIVVADSDTASSEAAHTEVVHTEAASTGIEIQVGRNADS